MHDQKPPSKVINDKTMIRTQLMHYSRTIELQFSKPKDMQADSTSEGTEEKKKESSFEEASCSDEEEKQK